MSDREIEEPRSITKTRGRPARLKEPVFFSVRFEWAKLKAMKEWCSSRFISFNEFVRQATEEFYIRKGGKF